MQFLTEEEQMMSHKVTALYVLRAVISHPLEHGEQRMLDALQVVMTVLLQTIYKARNTLRACIFLTLKHDVCNLVQP